MFCFMRGNRKSPNDNHSDSLSNTHNLRKGVILQSENIHVITLEFKQNEEKKLKRGYLICPTQDNHKRRHILKEASSYLYYDKKIINFFLFYNFF